MKTAIEWFLEQLSTKSLNDPTHDVMSIFEKAKELEKQQIVDAYNAGQYNGYPSDQNNNNDEDYYKTTFNK